MLRCFLLPAILMLPVLARCQEMSLRKGFSHYHRITAVMAYDFIPAAEGIDTQTGLYVVPVWGLGYDYWLTPHLALGLHGDMAIQKYEVRFEEKVITRSHPIKISLAGMYKISKHWVVFAGGGREYERSIDFWVVSFGTEYNIEIDRTWEVNFNLAYTGKLGAYDSALFGIGFSKKLGERDE